jgi:protoporphyrin/coproporphyrin ferrochelatase
MSNPGVLLVNLGSPDSPSVADVRRFLREFLMDKRVLDVSWPLRFCIVNFAILPRRPRQSAEAYRKIWTEEGSPLVTISRKVQKRLQDCLNLPVELAMRYGSPSIEQAVQGLLEQAVSEILLIPMFPHYAMSSYETAVVRVREVLNKQAPELRLRVIPPYYNHPAYIDALVASAEEFLDSDYDHLLFSFHGIPERHLHKCDPSGFHSLDKPSCCDETSIAHSTCYRGHCYKTVESFVRKTGIVNYSLAFQSRLGKEPWLKPYTDYEIERLAHAGIRKLLVICPSFVSDCLETIEEIGIRGREAFLRSGGQQFTLIPCLNDHSAWIAGLRSIVEATSVPTRDVCCCGSR